MPAELSRIRQESVGFVSQERLWLTSDGKIVRDGDWRASQLLVAKGGVIPEKLAKKLGLDKGVTVLDFQSEPPSKAKAVSPEDIAARSTRPEKPSAER